MALRDGYRQELLSPMADKSRYSGHLIDFNVRAERMGWLFRLRRSWARTRCALRKRRRKRHVTG
ncbi:hypothetical protein ACVXG7_11985 [Enterobacter hormaechei]